MKANLYLDRIDKKILNKLLNIAKWLIFGIFIFLLLASDIRLMASILFVALMVYLLPDNTINFILRS